MIITGSDEDERAAGEEGDFLSLSLLEEKQTERGRKKVRERERESQTFY